MKNLPFILMLMAFLVCQYTIYKQKQSINNYKYALKGHLEIALKCRNTLDETYSTLQTCSDTIDTAKEVMVQMYVQGAEDYMRCQDLSIRDNFSCQRIKLGIKKLGEYDE